MKNKKGILMAGTVLLFAFILTYTAFVVLIDHTTPQEQLKMGRMANDIYESNNQANSFAYFLQKSGEYALLETLKNKIENKQLMDNCENLYETPQCWFNSEEISRELEKDFGSNFEKYLKDNSYSVKIQDYKFKIILNTDYLIVQGNNENYAEFGEKSERKLKFRRNVNFESKLKFNFSEYNNLFDQINENLECLKKSEDKQIKEDIAHADSKIKPKECLSTDFDNVEKINGVLFFDYSIKSPLFDGLFKGRIGVDLNGFENSKNIADSSTKQ